jgi:hypothetical protein
MGWYAVSGRQVGWAAGLLLSQPPEHFVYPNYPVGVRWFPFVPFLRNIRFQFPAGINPLGVIGYGHPPGTLVSLLPSVSFSLEFYVQQGNVLPFVDVVIHNALWEVWNEVEQMPAYLLPLPFTFLFTVRAAGDPTVILRQVACPYAFISRLRGYTNEDRALCLQVDFVAPILQLLSSDFGSVVSNYDPVAPIPLLREIATDDWGERQVINLSWEVTNQLEFLHASWRQYSQLIPFLRTPPRLMYRGSRITVNLQILHPYFSSSLISTDTSAPVFDFEFFVGSRSENNPGWNRLLKFYQSRITSMNIEYSFDNAAVENVEVFARYLSWVGSV